MNDKELFETYATGNGNHCPFCGSDNVYSLDDDLAWSGCMEARGTVRCTSCGARWIDIMTTTGLIVVSAPSPMELLAACAEEEEECV